MNPLMITINGHMMDYQKKNNITRECIMNSLLFIHLMKENDCESFKPHSVIVLGKKNNKPHVVSGHMVVRDNDTNKMIECSYEIASLSDRVYFDNIKQFMDTVKEYFEDEEIKQLIKDFLRFKKTADTIISVMDIGIPIPHKNLHYFTSQNNYIKRQMKQKIKRLTCA
jgi:hypothetical protein